MKAAFGPLFLLSLRGGTAKQSRVKASCLDRFVPPQ